MAPFDVGSTLRATFALAQQPEQSVPATFALSAQAVLALSAQDCSQVFLSSPACADTQAITARVKPRMSFFIRAICSPKRAGKQAQSEAGPVRNECAATPPPGGEGRGENSRN